MREIRCGPTDVGLIVGNRVLFAVTGRLGILEIETIELNLPCKPLDQLLVLFCLFLEIV